VVSGVAGQTTVHSGAPQPSIDRLRRFGIRPKRKLGQNFLVDNNTLDVIAKAAKLGASDVVLEVGGGLGVLSEFLAARVDHVHVVEIDPGLRPALEEALAPYANTTLHIADAIELDLAALHPVPTKLVANLPYGVAASALIKAFDELPQLGLACVMTQREVAERLAAEPGRKLYGVTSVLVQLRCEVVATRRLARTIFHPVPNVDSSLVVLERTGANPAPGLVALVHDAFAHRRKPVAGSVALARGGGAAERERVAAALDELGLDRRLRAEALTPTQFATLYDALARKAGQ
jgi:16S rRNA (adenine1518-N6/adenine1519-N6)-dimethyltransferase